MRKCIPVILCFFMMLSLVSCDENDSITPSASTIIVEGWIEDNSFPVVMLTKPLVLSKDYQSVNDMHENIIKWAKVTVSDGTDEVILTGQYDSRYFPPYIYTTGRMRGKAGKTYKLTVDYGGTHTEASTYIPESLAIDSFSVTRSSIADTLYQVNVMFRNTPETVNYYQLFTRMGTDSRQYTASYLGTFDSSMLPDSIATVVVNRGMELKQTHYYLHYRKEDIVSVKLARVDSVSYNFWSDYAKNLSFSNNMFMPLTTNIRSNIVGGMGYWCGMGTSVVEIHIADYAYSK